MGFFKKVFNKIKDGVQKVRGSKLISRGAAELGKVFNHPAIGKVGATAEKLGFRRGGRVVNVLKGQRRGGAVVLQRRVAGMRAGGRVRKRMSK